MDINNYSYSSSMLENVPALANYENDDMYCSIDKSARGNIDHWENGFSVYAGSYDGSLEVDEFFRTIDAANSLYSAIIDSFSNNAPTKKAVRALINTAKRIDKKDIKSND